jgi:hypothetical protein
MSNLPTLNTIKLSQDELDEVGKLAAANYSAESVALHFDIPKNDFLAVFNDQNSELRQNYDRGRLQARFNILDKQRELAESGNITATQIFLKEADVIKIENLRNHCLFS